MARFYAKALANPSHFVTSGRKSPVAKWSKCLLHLRQWLYLWNIQLLEISGRAEAAVLFKCSIISGSVYLPVPYHLWQCCPVRESGHWRPGWCQPHTALPVVVSGSGPGKVSWVVRGKGGGSLRPIQKKKIFHPVPAASYRSEYVNIISQVFLACMQPLGLLHGNSLIRPSRDDGGEVSLCLSLSLSLSHSLSLLALINVIWKEGGRRRKKILFVPTKKIWKIASCERVSP